MFSEALRKKCHELRPIRVITRHITNNSNHGFVIIDQILYPIQRTKNASTIKKTMFNLHCTFIHTHTHHTQPKLHTRPPHFHFLLVTLINPYQLISTNIKKGIKVDWLPSHFQFTPIICYMLQFAYATQMITFMFYERIYTPFQYLLKYKTGVQYVNQQIIKNGLVI